MSYYDSRRSGTSPPRYIWWVVGIGALLVICGIGLNIVDNVRKTSAERSIAAVEERRVQVLVKLSQAEKEVRDHAGQFASHWSAEFPSQLQQSRQNLADNGQATALLTQAQVEFKAKHFSEAKSFADQADAVVTESLDVVNKILGPPSFYAELQRKSEEIDHGLVDTVQAEIDRQVGQVNGLERTPLCGSADKVLTFSRVYAQIEQARVQLQGARDKANERVEGKIDKPAVYDLATIAFQTAQGAGGLANQDVTDLNSANAAIVAAQSQIDNASAQIQTASYRQSEATTALDGARSTLTLARQACYSQNFTGAISQANQAQSQAINAVGISTPPTAVPVVVVVHDDNSGGSSGGSSWDSGSDWGGSDSGGSDSGGSDWGGSDSSWDSGGSSDWGGSDSSWDSGSDWGGSDSGSWDSGSDW